MPIIQPNIVVPDNIYNDYLAGKVDILGLAKDADTSRIVKHLDTIPGTDDSEGSGEAALVVAGIAALATLAIAVAGVTVHLVNKASQKKVEEFKLHLNAYITAVNEQSLTTEIIDNLIAAMDGLKKSTRKKICIQFSTDELASLVECLCNHTHTLAQANDVKFDDTYTEDEKTDILLRLRKNLIIQRDIFAKAA